MKDFINKLRVNRLIKKGYDYYTITIDNKIVSYVFNKP